MFKKLRFYNKNLDVILKKCPHHFDENIFYGSIRLF